MLYLIGLGLSEGGCSWEAYTTIKRAEKVYIDTYTIEFPYPLSSLENQFKRKLIPAWREFVEEMNFLEEAKKKDVVLLVYGNPLMATTHITIMQEAKKRKIKLKVLHNASVFDGISETGLQPYKFGKTASLPNFDADSYIDSIKDNLKINAHTLLLIDIGMSSQKAIDKFSKDCKNKKLKVDKILICERLGLEDSKISYGSIEKLKKNKVKNPFCIIIPGKLHFVEEEVLQSFNN